MSSQATILVVEPLISAQLKHWAEYGLCGDIFLVDREAALAARSEEQKFRVTGTTESFAQEAEHCYLTEYLARFGSIREVRFAWLRDCLGEIDDESDQMRDWAVFVDDRMPTHARPRLYDIVTPASLDLAGVPAPAQGFRQYVVAPEDHPSPTAPDAGWIHSREAITVHTALALVGSFAGSRPVPSDPADHSRVVHVFSRTVGGGHAIENLISNYVTDTLPTLAAHNVDSKRFALAGDPQSLIDSAVNHLTSEHPETFTAVQPTPMSLNRSGTFRHDWGRYCLAGLSWLPQRATNSLKRWIVQQTCVGINDSPWMGASGRQAWADRHTEDTWFDLDEGLTEGINARLRPVHGDTDNLPPHEAWQHLAQLATGLVDGGRLPQGFEAQYLHYRQVLTPDDVDPTDGLSDDVFAPAPEPEPEPTPEPEPETKDDESTSSDETKTSQRPVFPLKKPVARNTPKDKHSSSSQDPEEPIGLTKYSRHLSHLPTKQRKYQAIQRAAELAANAPRTLIDGVQDRYGATTMAVRKVDKVQQECARQHAQELTPAKPAPPVRSFLDRIQVETTAQWIASAATVNRLKTAATSTYDWRDADADASLQAALKKFGQAASSAVSFIVMVFVLHIFVPISGPGAWMAWKYFLSLYGFCWSILLAYAVFYGWRLARTVEHHAYAAWSCLEAKSLLATQAQHAMRQHDRLEHSVRIVEQWRGLIGALWGAKSGANRHRGPGDVPRTPQSCQLADATMPEGVERHLVVGSELAQPGFRRQALVDLQCGALDADPDKQFDAFRDLYRTDGMPGSKLSRLRERSLQPATWQRWHDDTVALYYPTIRRKVLDDFDGQPRCSSVATGEALDVVPFLSEACAPAAYQPMDNVSNRLLRNVPARHSLYWGGKHGEATVEPVGEITLTDALCSAAMLITTVPMAEFMQRSCDGGTRNSARQSPRRPR